MWFFRKKKKEELIIEPKKDIVLPLSISDFVIDKEVEDPEKELVSLITSCIAASDQSLSKFKVKSVNEIDIDKEIAVVMAGTILAQDNPHSQFRCVSIKEIEHAKKI